MWSKNLAPSLDVKGRNPGRRCRLVSKKKHFSSGETPQWHNKLVDTQNIVEAPHARTLIARKGWRESEQVVRWCFEGTPQAFRFIYARMGQMVEASSRGTLRAEATLNNIQHGSVSYIDVAKALVQLASDDERTWERKALFFNYANAEAMRGLPTGR